MGAPLTVESFGRQLVASGDLDPIYVMLNGAGLSRPVLSAWCMTYWMFYHAGLSSHVAEHVANGDPFWPLIYAQLPKGPRGTERRHFRGLAAMRSADYLAGRFHTPEYAIDTLAGGRGMGRTLPLRYVLQRAQEWVGFGPWIAFKIADMLDAVLGHPVDFTGSHDTFFSDPVKGAYLARWEWGMGGPAADDMDREMALGSFREDSKARQTLVVASVADELQCRIPGLKVQEAETILCKYKSHINGHYPLGKDTREIAHGLVGWGKLAESLINHLPEAPRVPL